MNGAAWHEHGIAMIHFHFRFPESANTATLKDIDDFLRTLMDVLLMRRRLRLEFAIGEAADPINREDFSKCLTSCVLI